MDSDLTPEEEASFDELLPPELRSGDDVTDLVAAAREARQRRVDNSRRGGHVLAALHRKLGSWRKVTQATGIPVKTAWNWAKPPK